MKKMRPFAAVICFLIFMQSYSQTPEEVKNKANIARNKVKNQISWDYKYAGEKPDKNGIKTSVTTYSPSGDIIQVNALNATGAVIHTENYIYDTRGNKTEYNRKSVENSYQKKYLYNEKNLLVEESGFDGVENFKNQYAFNQQGAMTEIRYLKNNILQEKRVFAKDGVTTTVSVFNRTGVLTSKLILIYDSRSNLVEESIYGASPNPLEKKTYNYDEKKKLKEESKFRMNKMTIRNTYNYNSAGALNEVTEEAPGSQKYIKKTLSYDPKGNLLEIKWRRNGSEDFNRISYAYDTNGLCTTADTFYPATKYRVLTRYTYEYY